jgi:hypothetical protein
VEGQGQGGHLSRPTSCAWRPFRLVCPGSQYSPHPPDCCLLEALGQGLVYWLGPGSRRPPRSQSATSELVKEGGSGLVGRGGRRVTAARCFQLTFQNGLSLAAKQGRREGRGGLRHPRAQGPCLATRRSPSLPVAISTCPCVPREGSREWSWDPSHKPTSTGVKDQSIPLTTFPRVVFGEWATSRGPGPPCL